jgi:hypothetical protein
MLKHLIAAGTVAMLAGPALGGQAGTITTNALYSGALADGLAELEPLAAADDHEAWFGIGAIRLTQAVEKLTQALYRHGFAVEAGTEAFGMGVILPVPQNPDPEPLDYEGVRGILSDLVAGLDAARPAFDTAAQAGDYVIAINPLKIRIDANGDGQVEDTESLAGLFSAWNGMTVDQLLAPPEPGGPPKFDHFGFDRADGYWFAGYTQVLAAQADFLLAHDFEEFTNSLFHRLFPRAGFPLQDAVADSVMFLDPQADTAIADFIAAIHTLDWSVMDAAQLEGVRTRLVSVLAYSRKNWTAILEETDDDHELLPSPGQTAIIPGTSVDDAKVAAWLVTLDKASDVLDGRLLLPHWRFDRGFDLGAYFETATETDLVMILTGLGAVPFLADGPIVSQEDFRAIEEAFGSDWLGYAFWFN